MLIQNLCLLQLPKNDSTANLKKLGHQVEISDLYAMQFNPVASKEDF